MSNRVYIKTVKCYLAHETRDGGAVVGLDGWRVAFIRALSAIGGGCTYTEAKGAYVHSTGRVQVEDVTVFESQYDADKAVALVPAFQALRELLCRYGREAQQASVRLVVDDRAVDLGEEDFPAASPTHREQFDIAAYFEAGENAAEVGA
jgi:hypothetical protein